MKKIITICAVVMMCSAVQAFADNFRCPNGNIVSTGDSISTVEVKCDPPAAKSENSGPFKYDAKNGSTRTTAGFFIEWTYTQGSTLLHSLIFTNGILREVRTGGFVQ